MVFKNNVVYCADFETTTDKNLKKDGCVRVWLWSLVKCQTTVNDTEKAEYYGTTIQSFLDKIEELKIDKIFFHNLRFDGYFLLSYFQENNYELNKDYSVVIDKLGTWYQVTYKNIKIWDSLKKFPGLSVNDIGEMYGCGGKEEKPNFDRYFPIDYEPTEEEIEYCLQDSRIIAFAISKEWQNGHKGITLSTDAFNKVKDTIGGFRYWRQKFPLLSEEEDKFARKSYKGGFVYVNPLYQNMKLRNIKVYDVNSLYPHVMANCRLPYGKPVWRPRPMKEELFIVKFKTKFRLKKGYLPTIQIKHDLRYNPTQYVENSCGEIELTMTSVDYELFHKHYYVEYEKDHTYMCFSSTVGMLATYISYYMDIKEKATIEKNKSLRYIAKRYMNSPYGKTGMNGTRINRVPYLADDDIVKFTDIKVEAESIYVPYASFVCAWARYITITTAQSKFNHFVYADTDSVHLIEDELEPEMVHPTQLGKFKLEGEFDIGKYIRAKTYIHCNKFYKVEEIKCAGMPDTVKDKIKYNQFNSGAVFKGKLLQTHVKGGCLLAKTTFKILV